MQKLVLASSSPFRREILDKLRLTYETHSPDIDESPLTDETPNALVARLAQQKAEAVTNVYPEALVIGSDQVAVLDLARVHQPRQQAARVGERDQAVHGVAEDHGESSSVAVHGTNAWRRPSDHGAGRSVW